MQVKGLRKVVKHLHRGIQIAAQFGRQHPAIASPSVVVISAPEPNPFAALVLPLSVDFAHFPSPTSGHDSSVSASNLHLGSVEYLAGHSTESSLFTSAVDHLSSNQDVSSTGSLADDASFSYASPLLNRHTPMLSDSSEASPRAGDVSASSALWEDVSRTSTEEGSVPYVNNKYGSEARSEESSSAYVEERSLDDSRFDTPEADTTAGDLVASNPGQAEQKVPDPFLVDEPDDSPVDHESPAQEEAPAGLSLDQSTAAADEVTLAQSPPPAWPVSIPNTALNLNKAAPLPPQLDEEDEEEDELPELYLPGLVLPTMFFPIPDTDPLTTLLIKFIPPERRPQRDLSGNWQGADFNILVMANSWRALAKLAQDRLVETDPEDLDVALSLWSLRLSCLARLRLFNQTSAECTKLFSVLHGVEPESARRLLFEKKVPFELEVLYARLKYWAGDHMGYLDALSGLLKRCKTAVRVAHANTDTLSVGMWQERGARICLIMASQLVEMKDYAAAAKLLEPLCKQPDGVTSPHLQSAVGRIYVQGGYIRMAANHFAAVSKVPTAEPSLKHMNAAILASANGDWPRATEEIRKMLEEDPENFVAINNQSVVLLSQGKIRESIQLLEEAIKISPSTSLAAEPLLFNLSTMYELRSTAGADRKRNLLVEVAKWAGDGLRPTCLKMPSG